MFLFRCVLHPLLLSSCLGCIPPLIGLPSLRFYAVGSSLFLLSLCFRFCLCFLFYRDDVLCWLLPCPSFSVSMLISDSRFDLVWFRLSCDHGWIRSGSVTVREQQQQQQQLVWYSTAVCIGLYTRYQYIFYLGTCTFVHGSLLLYNMHTYVCNYSGMCI